MTHPELAALGEDFIEFAAKPAKDNLEWIDSYREEVGEWFRGAQFEKTSSAGTVTFNAVFLLVSVITLFTNFIRTV